MKEYGFDEIQQMQQKALERVQNMKLRADRAISYEQNEYQPVPFSPSREKGHIKMPVNLPQRQAEIPPQKTEAASNTGILDNIFDEPDKALLMSLLMLFKGDKANEELMMALIYIML